MRIHTSRSAFAASRAILVSVILVWLAAAAVIFVAKRATPTAASVTQLIETKPLAGLSEPARARAIEKVAMTLNRLPFEERQQLRGGRGTRRYFETMTAAERTRFLELTLPTGFKQMMEAFNGMDPEKRKRLVSRALEEMQKREGDEPPPDLDDPAVQQIIGQGLKSFYNDANAETKLDLAPLIEQMQQGMQGMRR